MNAPLLHPSMTLICAVALVAAVAATALIVPQDASAAGAYVDSVTFIKQDPAAAVGNLIAGDIDMYYLPITKDESRAVRDAGHRVLQSTGGTVYSIYVNPTDDHANGFNPFSLPDVRYAINYLVDRDDIITNVLPSSGTKLFSAITPEHPDYDLVQDMLAALGLRYDPEEADRLFEEALVDAGASKGSDGRWTYDDKPIAITVFVRDDDAVRQSIGERLVADLDRAGFAVNTAYGDLSDVFGAVYGSDPAAQTWHLYTEAWGGSGVIKYDNSILASFYAPWEGNLPGGVEDNTLWKYEHTDLDRLTQTLSRMEYGSHDERADLVKRATELGVNESVRIFLAAAHQSYAVRDGITGVVNAPGSGIANRYTPINVQLPDDNTRLDIGVRHVAQSSWNPVEGLSDGYSLDVWWLLGDPGAARNPHTADLVPARNVWTSVETAGPDDALAVPPGTMAWSAETDAWVELPPGATATSKVTIDLLLSKWHHGLSMDVNDIFYAVWFAIEHSDLPDDPSIPVGLRMPDAGRDTIEVYLDYWHSDEAEIEDAATTWSTLPWEVYAAMESAVGSNQTHWDSAAASARGVSWLDMLDASDVALIRSHLVALTSASHDGHVPDFLYMDRTTAYVSERYDAAIQWIDARGHAVVSNGPFYLDSYSTDSDGTITELTVKRFDDPSYPFAAGHWDAFAIDPSQRICR
ncbi:MAG: ABC transporter substrate-binding protein [Thaumarchaeota archaeon]|nr:ABC transporter substrate-binding protein [Nitrososphaerota archaeon]